MISPQEIQRLALAERDWMITIRRELHRTPELSFQEERTAAQVAAALTALGVRAQTGVGGHGVVGVIHGTGDGKTGACVALRADMDALPVTEETGLPFSSENPGVMHACGHDVHMSALLGAARVLSTVHDQFSGSVKLIFQPAEERAPGGARQMIAAGVLTNPLVQSILGQHVNSALPAGSVGFRSGLFMAGADELYITVTGKGGHAAKPHLAVDPVAMSANLIVTLQQVVSRRADPTVPSVLTFGRVTADGAANVIPDTVHLAGTFRTVEDGWRRRALELIESTAYSLCATLGGRADVEIVRGYPPLVNDADVTERIRGYAVEYLGSDRVVELPAAMWSEDFAFYAAERPACFYNLGVSSPDGEAAHEVHTPTFTIDESAIPVGAGLMAWGALSELGFRTRAFVE